MATPKTCFNCKCQTHFTRMSMITYEDLCILCRKKEDEDIHKGLHKNIGP